MKKFIRAVRMAMNSRPIRCDSGWRWVLYIDF